MWQLSEKNEQCRVAHDSPWRRWQRCEEQPRMNMSLEILWKVFLTGKGNAREEADHIKEGSNTTQPSLLSSSSSSVMFTTGQDTLFTWPWWSWRWSWLCEFLSRLSVDSERFPPVPGSRWATHHSRWLPGEFTEAEVRHCIKVIKISMCPTVVHRNSFQ